MAVRGRAAGRRATRALHRARAGRRARARRSRRRRADAGRLAQRRDADGGPHARVLPRRLRSALLGRRPAGDPRRKPLTAREARAPSAPRDARAALARAQSRRSSRRSRARAAATARPRRSLLGFARLPLRARVDRAARVGSGRWRRDDGTRHAPSAGRYRLDDGDRPRRNVDRLPGLRHVLERPVAIKLMHREIASDSDQLERFRREARSVAQLNHPHIVTVIDAGEEPSGDGGTDVAGTPYIVLEYVEGETLKDRDPARGPARDHPGDRLRDRDRPRARRGPRAPDRPPRRQAAQRPAQRRRRREDHRLRHRAHAERGGPHARRARARHDRLRLARAGAGAARHRPVRPLLARGSCCTRCSPATCRFTATRRWRWR